MAVRSSGGASCTGPCPIRISLIQSFCRRAETFASEIKVPAAPALPAFPPPSPHHALPPTRPPCAPTRSPPTSRDPAPLVADAPLRLHAPFPLHLHLQLLDRCHTQARARTPPSRLVLAALPFALSCGSADAPSPAQTARFSPPVFWQPTRDHGVTGLCTTQCTASSGLSPSPL